MSEPRIYTKNFVNKNCVFTSSHGLTNIQYLCDTDKISKWISVGANSDATELTLQIDFFEGSQATSKTVGYIILVNHNLKDPTFEYYDGSAWQTLVVGSAVSSSTTVFSFTEKITGNIRVRCSTTQIANAEKFIGEFIACAGVLTPSKDMVSYDVTFNQRKTTELMLANGAIHRTTVMFTTNRSSKYEANVRFDFLTQAELTALQTLRDTALSFLWQPESVQRPDEIYLVNWTGSGFKQQYISTYKGAGYRVDLAFKEV